MPLDGAKKAQGSKDDLKGDLGSFLKVNAGVNTVRAHPWCLSALAFTIVNRVCMALLYGCTGRLTVKNVAFRPGQHGALWLAAAALLRAADPVYAGFPFHLAVTKGFSGWCTQPHTRHNSHSLVAPFTTSRRRDGSS